MTYRFPDLANKVAAVIAIVLVVIAMDGRWFIGTPARAEPNVSPSAYPPRKPKSEVDKPRPVPLAGTAPTGPATSSSPATPSSPAPGKELGDEAGCAARSGKRALTGTLDLNTATVEQLTLLPGIGPAKAERIVAWRRKHGPFRRTADLRRVSGFGFKTFKRLEAYLAITGPTTLAGG